MYNEALVRDLVRILSQLRIYDVSPLFETNMPGWSSHPTLGIIPDARNFEQNGYYAQTLVISEHTGSHVDAPRHIHPGMETIDELPADVLIGPYKKYDLTPFDPQPGVPVDLPQILEAERTAGFRLEPGDIAVLQFGWDQYYRPDSHDPAERAWWGRNCPGLTEEACRYFAESGIKAIGADTVALDMSVKDGVVLSRHGHSRYFLPHRILIVEGLQSLALAPPVGLFLAAPLKIKNGSGSPIRPLLIG